MILVTVGTNEARFDRLLSAVAELRVDEELLVQHGHSFPIEHPWAKSVDFLPFEAMAAAIARARVVITHAGVGSVMVSLANGKRPVVVPRRKLYAEAVDDHQLQLGRRFAQAGLVTLVEHPGDLAQALVGTHAAGELAADPTSLAADLRVFVQQSLDKRGPVRT